MFGWVLTWLKAEGKLQADTREDFKSQLPEMNEHEFLFEPEYSKKDLRHVEEKEEAPAAGAAERQAHFFGRDEGPDFKNNYSFLLH